jgi:hypothetical protein
VVLGTARWQFLPWATPRSLFRLSLAARLALPGGLALSAEVSRIPTATEGTLGVFAYF